MIPAGIAAHAGSPETRSAKRPEPPEQRHLPAAVAEPEPQQHGGDEQRGAGRDRDLVQRGAARGLGLGEQVEHAGECIVV